MTKKTTCQSGELTCQSGELTCQSGELTCQSGELTFQSGKSEINKSLLEILIGQSLFTKILNSKPIHIENNLYLGSSLESTDMILEFSNGNKKILDSHQYIDNGKDGHTEREADTTITQIIKLIAQNENPINIYVVEASNHYYASNDQSSCNKPSNTKNTYKIPFIEVEQEIKDAILNQSSNS